MINNDVRKACRTRLAVHGHLNELKMTTSLLKSDKS